jgi:hypothetical protein
LVRSQNNPPTDNLLLSANKILFIKLYVAKSVDVLALKLKLFWGHLKIPRKPSKREMN